MMKLRNRKGETRVRILVIDRFEGAYAICEDKDQKLFAIEAAELPAEAAEGSVLEIDDEGTVRVNAEKTAVRRSKVKNLQDSLWKE